MKPLAHYKFLKSLRPFSLVVALISCGLGVLIAWNNGYQHAFLGLWIIIGGVLAQAGINLINDLEDLSLIPSYHPDYAIISGMIRTNSKAGLLCFVLAGLIASYLIMLQGWMLFMLILLSALASLSYNIGPFNFKHRGLAMVQVFILMGVLMMQGAYFSMSGAFSITVLWHSIPIGLLISLLLLSNELRDWETDQQNGVNTLTVRIGYTKAVQLYWALIMISYLLAIGFLINELQLVNSPAFQLLWLALPLPLLIPIKKIINAKQRIQLTPMTGRFFFLFGCAYMLVLGIE
ncbi:MAG: prenyltransferase [Cocleimonas sp.]|nr:prenyltransferase [Cocleimonas sp.]